MHSQAIPTRNKQEFSKKRLSTQLEKANQLFASGKLEGAKRIYCEVLTAAPNHSELLHMIGLVDNELGNYKSAEVYFCKAINADPTKQGFYINLGQFYHARNRSDDALNAYKKALRLNPDCPEILCLIGDVYKKAGLYEQAAIRYQKSIEQEPKLSSAYNNLGNCYQALNKMDSAIECYQRVLTFNPNDANATYNLGNAYLKLNLLDEAIVCYRRALVQAPDCAEIYNCLATAYLKKREYEIAADVYQKALNLEPDNFRINHNFGTNLLNQGKHTESMKCFTKALKQNPEFQPAVMHSLLCLPIIYTNQAEIDYHRTEYSRGLDVLLNDWEAKKKEKPKIHLEGVAGWINFYLPYQGRNDLSLQKKFGRYLSSVMETNYPEMSVPKTMPVLEKREKIRIGYISENMYSHTVGKLFIGWVENADPSEFEIYCYHTQNITDSLTERFKKASFKYHHIIGDRDRIAEQIVADKIHILVFLDIGMNAPTQLLAALRLAPVQCVAWGHPLTTGLPSVDYFLSSDFMEPVNGQDHYSEALVKLPNLSIYYNRPQLPKHPKSREEFGLKDDNFVYLSTQSLFKYLPEDDFIYPNIALSIPNSKFVFIQHESDNVTDLFKKRLGLAFDIHKLDAKEFCIFQPRLSHHDFLSLNIASDVLLDPPAWSGGMTSLEGISCGIPVVTVPGKFMRSRHTYSMLKIMGIRETIAGDKNDYIQIASRLGTDLKFRAGIRKSIDENLSRLYEDRAVIISLEGFYRSLMSGGAQMHKENT